ncbi:MAG: hypothetical protein HYZ21_11815 [Chloroflexi bacterium]|nr:hypothetical protein [Chloroflexota bacterium]
MRNDRGLTSSIRGMTRCSAEIPGRRHRVTARRSGLGHRGLPSRPGARQFDGSTRTIIIGLHFFE